MGSMRMCGCGCLLHITNSSNSYAPPRRSSSLAPPSSLFRHHLSPVRRFTQKRVGAGRLPQSRQSGSSSSGGNVKGEQPKVEMVTEEAVPPETNSIISACLVGLFTGISVVLFNNVVHEIRDLCWDGIPYRGASWLREEAIEGIWERVILVPTFGGLIVGMLNMIRDILEVSTEGSFINNVNAALKPILKTLAACVTLGTGNSLGPEGPSVEIGESVAKGIGRYFDKGARRKLSLRAAGSAAGISSGFNAAVAGCFFAVESVLWPSPAESSISLTNTTSTVILSAVIASVVSEIGLGSEPAFTVPDYDFRSPSGKKPWGNKWLLLFQLGFGVYSLIYTMISVVFLEQGTKESHA